MALVSPNRHTYKPIHSASPPCASCSSPGDLVPLQCPDQLGCTPSDQLTAQCTDQCVVIACNDPDHTELICGQTGPHSQCDFVCDETVDCLGCHGFDAFLKCCDDYRPYGADSVRHAPVAAGAHLTSAWEMAFAEWCAACAEMGNAQTVTVVKGAEVPIDSRRHASLQDVPFQSGSRQPVFEMGPFSQRPHHPPTPAPGESACMWAGCNATFSSLSELVGHVNLDHLAMSSTSAKNHAVSDSGSDAASISCLWDNCGSSYYSASNSFELLAHHLLNDHLNVDSLSYPQHPHQGNQLQQERSNLHPHHHPQHHVIEPRSYEEQIQNFQRQQHQHQHQHHHGHQQEHQHHQQLQEHEVEQENPLAQIYAEQLQVVLTNSAQQNDIPSMSPGPPPHPPSLPPESEHGVEVVEPLSQITAPSNHNCGGAHECRWKDCGISFSSCDALTTHINDVHIGGGKAHYECFWDECPRNSAQGFQSKQKISRHVQSHTGHRPFQCSICQQNFSEAATLQQHIRRHTQEKPYVCDHPGCGKSFAITGALTIHKRTHNGDKPFKCSYCDRGFAESSNLSKHLRTHTGARPYICTEPGCGKAFARPDQLNRHKGVHKKQIRGVGRSAQE